MKALVLHPPGGPEDLTYAEVRSPRPATGDVLVRVHAAGWLAPSGTVVSVVEPPTDGIDGKGHFLVVEADRAHLELIADRAQVGHLRAPIGAVYPLSDGRQAFIDKTHRKVRGKGLLVPAVKSLS